MIKKVIFGGREIEYTLERKPVKNINLRVRRDGSVYVSANRRVPNDVIERFILANADKILTWIERVDELRRIEESSTAAEYSKDEIIRTLTKVFDEIYPTFAAYGIEKPTLRIREMKSRWGSCIPSKKVVTLNSRLIAHPRECIEYVVVHEFCHFFEANHSSRFYAKMDEFMPDWKNRRAVLENRKK